MQPVNNAPGQAVVMSANDMKAILYLTIRGKVQLPAESTNKTIPVETSAQHHLNVKA